MKSKIDIFNATFTILCVVSVIFSSAYKENIFLRILCLVLGVSLLIGIIVKVKKGGSDDGRKEA